MRGTANTVAGLVTGSPFKAAEANDIVALLSSADDDALYELFHLAPPASVSYLNPTVGFVPLTSGPLATGNASGRTVTVNPVRVMRSSIDNTQPRALLSGVVSTPTTVNMPAAPGSASTWGIELLYAQLTYVDASNPTKGTVVSLLWAPSPTYVSTASAPNVAALPANTNSVWNIPIRYVKNYNGQTAIASADILDVSPLVAASISTDYRMQIVGKLRGGFEAKRAYSSANQSLASLVAGGASVWQTIGASFTQKITSTGSPIMAVRRDSDFAIRTIYIPAGNSGSPTAGTSGSPVVVDIDDTRDWRGATFTTLWFVPNNAAQWFGEEDASLGASGTRVHPIMQSAGGGTAFYAAAGQSWNATQPAGGGGIFPSQFWAANVSPDVTNNPANGASNPLLAGDGWGLYVDSATGVLKFWGKRAGTGTGFTVFILLIAEFGNHR